MRERRVYILSLLFAGLFCLSSQAQNEIPSSNTESPLALQIKAFYNKPLQDSEILSKQTQSFQQYITKLETIKAKRKTDLEFLKTVFFKTHRKYLKRYSASATFKETMDTGVYGCLTGTALYAMILSHFGYDFEIIELTSHVYLKVNLEGKMVLIESTLPEEGFLVNVSAIAKATEQYEDNSRNTNSIIAIAGIEEGNGKSAYKRSISLKQLSGLQYYNMAIYNIKDKALEIAFSNAREAIDVYPSKRTDQLMEIVINKILQSKNLTKDLKSGILNTYVTQVKKRKLTQR